MPCCSTNRSQRSSAITSIRLETERFSKESICSSLFRCSSRTVRLSFDLFLFLLDFAIRSFLHLVLHRRSGRLKDITLYAKNVSENLCLICAIGLPCADTRGLIRPCRQALAGRDKLLFDLTLSG